MCAAPWPSQQRRGPPQSDRSAALARIHARRAEGSGRHTPDDEEPPARPAARPPPRPRSGRESPRPARDHVRDEPMRESRAEPWAPAWSPDVPRRPIDAEDEPLRRASPRHRVTPPSEDPVRRASPRPPAGRADDERRRPPPTGSRRASEDETHAGGGRVRGPQEARAARGGAPDDDPLPAGVKGADFSTLQQMIAKGIEEAESGASVLEGDVIVRDDDEELRRIKEARARKLEEEAERKQKERQAERAKRQREYEELRRRQELDIEREVASERLAREESEVLANRCLREHRAASHIQGRVRGRRSRAGKPTLVAKERAKVHSVPHMDSPWTSGTSGAPRLVSAATPELLG